MYRDYKIGNKKTHKTTRTKHNCNKRLADSFPHKITERKYCVHINHWIDIKWRVKYIQVHKYEMLHSTYSKGYKIQAGKTIQLGHLKYNAKKHWIYSSVLK